MAIMGGSSDDEVLAGAVRLDACPDQLTCEQPGHHPDQRYRHPDRVGAQVQPGVEHGEQAVEGAGAIGGGLQRAGGSRRAQAGSFQVAGIGERPGAEIARARNGEGHLGLRPSGAVDGRVVLLLEMRAPPWVSLPNRPSMVPTG